MKARDPLEQGQQYTRLTNWSGVVSLAMLPFYAGYYAATYADLRSASHSLVLAEKGQYPTDQAWQEASDAISEVRTFCDGLPLKQWLSDNRKIERAQEWIARGLYQPAATCLLEMAADLALEVVKYEALLIPPEQGHNYCNPLQRFGIAADKFKEARDSMTGASQCLALDQWQASVYHSMGVLEHGLRWLGSQFTLTLKKPLELENWETIIGNIEKQVRAFESAGNAKKRDMSHAELTEFDNTLTFYSRACQEFRYFKDAWRNHVMHEHDVAYDSGTATSVIDHVASFMKISAERA